MIFLFFFFFQAEDGIRDLTVTGVQTCALPISPCRETGFRLRPVARDAAVPAPRADERVALERLEPRAKREGLLGRGEPHAALDRHRPRSSPEPHALHDLRPGRQRVVLLDPVAPDARLLELEVDLLHPALPSLADHRVADLPRHLVTLDSPLDAARPQLDG